MEIREHRKQISDGGSLRTAGVIICLLAAACVLGFAVVLAGSSSSTQTLAVGGVFIALFGAAIAFLLEIPMIWIVRYGYIASFFFKSDISLFKIDEIEDPSGFNLSLTLILGLILLVHDWFTDKEKPRVLPAAFSMLLAGLVVCSVVSVIYAGATPLGGVSVWSLLTSILIVYVTASHFGRRDRIVQLVVGLAIGVLFTGSVALAQYSVGWPLNLPTLGTGTEGEQFGTQSIELSRVPGFMRTPTGMGWVISCMIPIILAPLVCRVKAFNLSQRFILLTAVLAGVVGIILSLARGSWIGLVAAVTLLALFGWFRLSERERSSYLVTVGGAFILSCVLLTPFAGRIYNRLTEDDNGAASVRIPLMENALNMMADNPLTGVGLNGYRTHMTRYDETGNLVSQEFPNPVHNVFAHVAVEVGIPGGIMFCALFLFAFAECFKTMTMQDRLMFALGLGAAAALVAFIISGVKEPGSLGSVRTPMRTLFLLLGMVMALGIIRRRVTPERFEEI